MGKLQSKHGKLDPIRAVVANAVFLLRLCDGRLVLLL